MNRSVLAAAIVLVGSFWCQEVRALQQVRAVFTGTAVDNPDGLNLPASLALADFSLNSDTVSGNNPEGSRFVLQYVIGSLEIQAIVQGDINLDGSVDFSDITPFISVLASDGFQDEADVNESGTVDFSDISPFIGLLVVCQR